MSAVADTGLVKCPVCNQMTAPLYIVQRGPFSTMCRMCEIREERERKDKRKPGTGPRGLVGWIIPGLILGGVALWYFKVDVPGVDQGKALFAHLVDSASEEGGGSRSGSEKNPPAGSAPAATSPNTANTTGALAAPTLTLNLRSDVLFEFGNSALKAAAGNELTHVAKVIHEHPRAAVVIRGYTDSKGSEPANLALSRQRAESVRDWMVKSGIPARQLSILGMGAKDPVAPNTNADGTDNPAGRDQNRRVTVTVTGA